MKTKYRILHTEWSDGWGGQEIRILNEMIGLREEGAELFLACRPNSKIAEKAIVENFKVFLLSFNGNLDIVTLYKLVQVIKSEKINILNTHSGKDTWVGGLAAKICGIKFIRTRHLSNQINNSRFNFINELADYIITTGESVKLDMITRNRIDSYKISSVPTGIDETLFDPNSYNVGTCRKYFGLLNNEIIIGTVGVLRSFKRHDVFIDLAKKLIEEHPESNFKFLIAGEGPQRQPLESKINLYNLNDKIKLLGHIDNVPEFLKSLDLFLFTSDSKEGVPQSVMQALMMNKRIIATNVGSTVDLYRNNNFIIVDFDFEKLYSSSEDALFGKHNIDLDRQFIVDNFSKKRMVEKIINIYSKLVK